MIETHTSFAIDVTQLRACPVCDCSVTTFVRDVPTRRTKRMIALYACLDCRSFFNPSDYSESADQLERDVAWGVSVTERNIAAARKLFDHFAQTYGVQPRQIVEIGCGTGALLQAAEKQGISAIGFDVNERAIAHARSEGLDARAEQWTAATALPKVDLFLSMSVVEHLDQPRPLIREMCMAAKAHSAHVFISAPLLDRDKWHFVLDPDPWKQGTPFFDNDVHVTHFSRDGLRRSMEDFGITNLRFVDQGLWHGWLGGPA